MQIFGLEGLVPKILVLCHRITLCLGALIMCDSGVMALGSASSLQGSKYEKG